MSISIKNTRFVTFTKTETIHIDPTVAPTFHDDELYDEPLFEHAFEETDGLSTLPPIDIGDGEVAAILETVTETFSTTELMYRTSVLPVLYHGETSMYTLTQTFHISRVVTALKTLPPYESFDFIPENSLNEFNGQLLAEGTENGQGELPSELEYDENGEVVDTNTGIRVPPPPGFQDTSLADLAGGSFNLDALEQRMNPEFVALLKQKQQQQLQQKAQQNQQLLSSTGVPNGEAFQATPALSPEQLQFAYFQRLMNPFQNPFGGFPVGPQVTVTSTPVTYTTDLVTTSTRVLRVIFNAKPILTTISSIETVHTTLTSYDTTTMTLGPQVPAFPFQFPGANFPLG